MSWISGWIDNPINNIVLYGPLDVIDEESVPEQGEEWVVKYIPKFSRYYKVSNGVCNIPQGDGLGNVCPAEIITSGKTNLLYYDFVRNNIIINQLIHYLLPQNNIMTFNKIKVFDSPTQGIKLVMIREEGIYYPLKSSDNLSIFSILFNIYSFLHEINKTYKFLHGCLTIEDLEWLAARPAGDNERVVISDLSFASFMLGIRKGGVDEDYMLLPDVDDYRTLGDCPLVDVDGKAGYYYFQNPNLYLIAWKRGDVARMAFSQKKYFNSMDFYTILISLLMHREYNIEFFNSSQGQKIWSLMFLTPPINDIKIQFYNTPGDYPIHKFSTLEYLSNKPLGPLKSLDILDVPKILEELVDQ